MGLWVDGIPIVPPNGGASRALLGVDLQKMKAPQQMLWVAVVREVLALDDELPDMLNDNHARSKELAEELCLRQPGTDATFRSVLDVPSDGQEVGEPVDSIVDDVGLVGAIVVVARHVGGSRYRRGGRGRCC